MTKSIQNQLEESGLFRDFPEDVKRQLESISTLENFSDGDVIYSCGDEPTALYGVVNGSVKLMGESSEGKYYVYGLVPPGHWVGEISVLDGMKRGQRALAVGNVELSSIKRSSLLNLLQSRPVLYQHFINVFCGRLRLAGRFIEETAFSTVAIRLAHQLLRFAKIKNGETLALSQEELAASLGVTRQSIYRTLGKWQRLGWIEQSYGSITISMPGMIQKFIEEYPQSVSMK